MTHVKPRRAAKPETSLLWNALFVATILATAGLVGVTVSILIWG